MMSLEAIEAANEREVERQRKAGAPELLKRCDFQFDEKAHKEPWRNKVAAQLNELLGRIEFTLETGGDESDVSFSKAALSIIERVEIREEIKRSKPKRKLK